MLVSSIFTGIAMHSCVNVLVLFHSCKQTHALTCGIHAVGKQIKNRRQGCLESLEIRLCSAKSF